MRNYCTSLRHENSEFLENYFMLIVNWVLFKYGILLSSTQSREPERRNRANKWVFRGCLETFLTRKCFLANRRQAQTFYYREENLNAQPALIKIPSQRMWSVLNSFSIFYILSLNEALCFIKQSLSWLYLSPSNPRQFKNSTDLFAIKYFHIRTFLCI